MTTPTPDEPKIDTEAMLKLIADLANREQPRDVMRSSYISRATIPQSVMMITWLLAQLRSKDPNTRVGACVYDGITGALHLGYNGLNEGEPDLCSVWDNRDPEVHPNKYDLVRHAEENAIGKAMKAGFNPAHSSLYVTHYPCPTCVKSWIRPSGIRQVIIGSLYPYNELSQRKLQEAGIMVSMAPLPLKAKSE